MKPFYFLFGLLITMSIIYVVCQEMTENFESSDSDNNKIKTSTISFEIAKQLQIDSSRIRDLQEIGNPGNLAEYQIKLKIFPRNIVNQSDPLITDIFKTLQKKQVDKTPFKITNADNNEVFLSEIKVDMKDINNSQKETEKSSQFINPALDAQIQYLSDTQSGIPYDQQLDRVPKWHKGEIIIPPETIPTPRPTHPLTDQATVPTMSFID
uniref:Uncharacterized protein n=1 Tax=viral metagenome TaxID=1070528 RepID=A0A6C0E9N0_9ZZZZ